MTARPIPLFADRPPATEAFTVGRRGFVRVQVAAVAVLTVLGALALVDPGAEGSVATWWSSFNLAVAAGLTFLVSRRAARVRRLHGILWVGLAVVMLLLSVDEVARIHDHLNTAQVLQGALPESLPLRPSLVFGGAFAAVVALAASPLLIALPRRVAGLIVLAGAVFVGGAVLKEGEALILIGDAMEMGAIALFNIVLFNTLIPPGLTVRFPDTAAAPTAAARSGRIEAAE